MCNCKSQEHLGNFGDCQECKVPTVQRGQPHKHAEVIKAWADGAKIQYKFQYAPYKWVDVYSPTFNVNYEYRVKPEPKPDIVNFHNVYPTNKTIGIAFPSCFRAIDDAGSGAVGLVKFTWDGETGKLKSAEII